MKEIVYFIIIFKICLSDTQTFHKSFRGLMNSNFANKQILEIVLAEKTVGIIIVCAVSCMETSGCISFAYNTISEQCFLWNKDFLEVSSTNIKDEIGWRYYYFALDCSLTKESCLVNQEFVYEPDTCLCYKYIATKMWYNDSFTECDSLNAELMKVDRALVQRKMEKYLDSVTNGEVRIQGVLDVNTNTWRYNDGTEMQYFNWNTDQPQNRTLELYIIIRKSGGYKWHDTFTDEKFTLVCQIR